MASRSEDDLTCPTCMNIFNNPVLLSCGHSSCSECLQRWWKENKMKNCPLCRARCTTANPPRNLALKNLCETFLQEQEKKANPDELREKLTALKLRMDHLRELKDGYDKILDHVKAQVKTVERQIKRQFRTLHRFLEEDEEARIADLREEEERKSQTLRELVENIGREMASLSEIVRVTEDALDEENASGEKCKTAIDKAMQQRNTPDDSNESQLIDVTKHVGNLSFKIWQKMLKVVRYYPVILDPNTAGNLLSLSEDLTAFKEGEDQRLPDTRDRLSLLSVLGSEGYSSGKHSWDVQFGESKCWGVGVIEKKRPDHRLEEGDSWRLVNGFFGLMALEPDYEGVAIPSPSGLEVTRIRLELDYASGSLALINLDSYTLIHKFRHRFKGKVYPYFYNWDQNNIRVLPKHFVLNSRKNGIVVPDGKDDPTPTARY
ncbi:E3 ubiquitin-protein ligase TRIM35-like [Periophthalmus magnuspinnatus]|uniref:E3 ubiquitin-protein ligase TRIM35-like n=1 Tax=Periophthalmus magnuspinnatus TaxID=409849 RepID=UPI002436B3B8|nr:E3 ubiquitin-protein ligase TRIM35-like [Periophthalmus magnuspinnatus]